MKVATLKSIFLNQRITSEILRLHNQLGSLDGTLRAHLVWTRDFKFYPALIDEMIKKDPRYKSVAPGISDLDVKMLYSRSTLVFQPEMASVLDDPLPNLWKLEAASLCAFKPIQAIPFKTFVLSMYGKRHGAPENQYEWEYRGMLPYTAPVHLATQALFNLSFRNNQYRHTLFCQDLAAELKISPLQVNTTLWLLGQEVKPLEEEIEE